MTELEVENREIERKFLPANDGWRGLAAGRSIRQGYLCIDPRRTVRVRMSEDQAWLTIKGQSRGAVRAEFEYPIAAQEAEYMLEHLALRPVLEKIRYSISLAGFLWEVDEFLGDNQGLVLIEIELEREDAQFPRPDWLGQEVTGDRRYYNANLLRRPFKSF
ncbi:MAG: CYTH domain-containing protein [Desulfovibrio sp.]|jgi:adenylate cyclase|nr:CYTH domain-containing protein [Desulfovibrio sp.]